MEKNELLISVFELEKERNELVNRKGEIVSQLMKLKKQVRGRGQILPQNEYNSICSKQERLRQEQRIIENKLSNLNLKMKQKNIFIFKNNENTSKIELLLINLKNKYMDFSSDNTRVNSMRLIASQFAQEIDEIIKSI